MLRAAILLLAIGSAAVAQTADERDLRRPVPRTTAHPGLFAPANDLHQRAAFAGPSFPQMPRAWFIEARTRITARPEASCADCGDPIRRRNHRRCDRCDARWWKLAAARWDFPLGE